MGRAPNKRINLTNHGPESTLAPGALLAVAGREGARRVGVDGASVENDVAAVVDAMAAW